MRSFGKLLRNLRGTHPLPTLAEASGVAAAFLAGVEAGEHVVDPETARRILARGLGLPPAEVERLLLGIQLYDLGLRDASLRKIVIAVIHKEAPPGARAAVIQAYRELFSDVADAEPTSTTGV